MTTNKPIDVEELAGRIRRRAETYNTGSPVNPEAIGTLGYYAAADAKLDTEAATALRSLSEERDRWKDDAYGERTLSNAINGMNRRLKEENTRLAARLEAAERVIKEIAEFPKEHSGRNSSWAVGYAFSYVQAVARDFMEEAKRHD